MPETPQPPVAEQTRAGEGADCGSIFAELNRIADQVRQKALQSEDDPARLAALNDARRQLASNLEYWVDRVDAGKISPEGAIAEFRSLVETVLRIIESNAPAGAAPSAEQPPLARVEQPEEDGINSLEETVDRTIVAAEAEFEKMTARLLALQTALGLPEKYLVGPRAALLRNQLQKMRDAGQRYLHTAAGVDTEFASYEERLVKEVRAKVRRAALTGEPSADTECQ